ncbi:Vitamin B12 import ATP-binding protein BtuD [Sporomusa carbonis]|uniref:ABC transporter ATP-binding protein n=1 Tax=Sporomusa carbonis TaxID=3076075 RepID=UPI003A7A068A
MSNDIAIRVENLSKVYKLYNHPTDRLKEALHPFNKKYHHDFYALKDVSFEVKRGETVGVIGKNGSGKSTLLKIITGVLTPSSGTVNVKGRVSALLELGAGFNPEYTGMENIFLQGFIMGYTREEMEQKVEAILTFADIGDFIYQPVKSYSSGMFVRLAFSVATIVDPDVLIIDEALAVGDVFFRQKCFDRLETLKQNNTSVLLVTHATHEVRQFCQRALFLDHGQALFWGNADEAVQRYYFSEHQQSSSKKVNQIGSNKEETKRTGKQQKAPKENSFSNQKVQWPIAQEAFFNIVSSPDTIGDGAICTTVGLCNSQGDPCRMFVQGDIGVFFYEFELQRDVEVPIGGILLFNEKNILIHGKNSMQFDTEAPKNLKAGTKIRFRQAIKFDLASGEYTFSIGLASIEEEAFQQRSQMHSALLEQYRTNLCYVRNIGTFSIAISLGVGITEIPFHGICDLPGEVCIEVQAHRFWA